MTDRTLWGVLLLGAALSIAISCAIATQSVIVGSADGRWFYGYVRAFSTQPVGAALLVTGFASALLLALRPRPGVREWTLVFGWVAAATALQAPLRSLTPVGLDDLLTSDAASSFYSVTQRLRPSVVLRSFEQVQAAAPLHVQSNMPGKLMLLYALQVISVRTDVLPWLLIGLSNAGGALLYGFVRNLFGDRRVALYSLVLYLFVPAKLFFLPLMNTVTPVVVFACACLLLAWLQSSRARYAALLGAAVYALVFFEPLPLVMGVLFAALIGRALWQRAIGWRQILRHVGLGVGTFGAVYAAMRLWFGFDLFEGLWHVGAHAARFNAAADRPYSVWIRANLWEFIFGVGFCQFIAYFGALAGGLHGPDAWPRRFARPITAVCLSLAAILLITDLVGVNRGEVIRLWIFLACFFQIPAAYLCARLPGDGAILIVLSTTVLQGALGTAMIGFVSVE
jgi:hypothetical protein